MGGGEGKQEVIFNRSSVVTEITNQSQGSRCKHGARHVVGSPCVDPLSLVRWLKQVIEEEKRTWESYIWEQASVLSVMSRVSSSEPLSISESQASCLGLIRNRNAAHFVW